MLEAVAETTCITCGESSGDDEAWVYAHVRSNAGHVGYIAPAAPSSQDGPIDLIAAALGRPGGAGRSRVREDFA